MEGVEGEDKIMIDWLEELEPHLLFTSEIPAYWVNMYTL